MTPANITRMFRELQDAGWSRNHWHDEAVLGFPTGFWGWITDDDSTRARAMRMESHIFEQNVEIKRLRSALLRYGEHLPSCDLGKACQCGFGDYVKGTLK